jgi:Protein of unknown function (DUF2442)
VNSFPDPMSDSPEPLDVRFDEIMMWVDIEDGRTLGIPLVWFPRLAQATPQQRLGFELSPSGIHWDEIDEDISIAGLIAGRGDMTHPVKSAA